MMTLPIALWLATPPEAVPSIWELTKGLMLFVITGSVGFAVKLLWSVRDLVKDHETAIYGREGQNGLKRGLKQVTDRVDLIEDRNTAIDAVAAAEKAQYTGEERRHAAVRQLAEIVKQEMQADRRKE